MSWYVLQERMLTCHVHNALFNGFNLIQGKKTRNGARSMFAVQERTRKIIRNRREEGRPVENAKRSATVETADRPRGPADSIMLPGPREGV